MLKNYALEDHSIMDFSLLSSLGNHIWHRCNGKIWDIFDLLAKDSAKPYNR
jgi:hypothetical protein